MPERSAKIVIKTAGFDNLIKALKDVGTPSYAVTHDLQTVLNAAFAQTQGIVHVISGRLKASGYTEDDFDGEKWEGTINYGGSSGSPAYYGIYELNRGGTRPDGTPHDFFSGLSAFDKAFQEAIDKHMRKLR
jgi:hypothetical protein